MLRLSPRSCRLNRIALLACLCVVLLPSPSGQAAPASVDPTSSTPGTSTVPEVQLSSPDVSIPADGAFSYTASIRIGAPASYVESRLQIKTPDGKLIFQKTEIRHDVATETVDVQYSRSISDLGMDADAYPVELRVRATVDGASKEWTADRLLLVYERGGPRVPVALVVRITSAPAVDPAGRFVVDPASSARAREEASELARLVLDDPRIRVTAAIPGVLLEEWVRVSQGYEVAAPEGIVTVPESGVVPIAHRQTLEALRRALATGRLQLAHMPYASPSAPDLAGAGRLTDLEPQFARGLSSYIAALETTPAPVAVLAKDLLPTAALPWLNVRDLNCVLLSDDSLASGDATPSTGVYRIAGAGSNGPCAVVLDRAVSNALQNVDGAAVVHGAFGRAVSDEATRPVIAIVDVGPGRTARLTSLGSLVSTLARAPWIDLVTVQQAATTHDSEVVLRDSIAADGAPPGYWSEVSEAAGLGSGFLSAAGVNDPDAQAAMDAALIAESRCWAGPDDSWSLADRGRAYAAAAQRASSGVLDAVTLSAPDITLSSSSGDVPISIVNASDKNLQLTLKARASRMALTGPAAQVMGIRPQENLAAVSVDLQSSLSGRLELELWAGEVLLDSTSLSVQASFLDRLAIVGGVAVLLAGLLLFIRHRVRTADNLERGNSRKPPRAGGRQ